MNKQTALLVSFLLSCALFISCNKRVRYNYYNFNDIEKQSIKKNHITQCTETRIDFDSSLNILFKRLEKQRTFNENGSCIEEIKPLYKAIFGKDLPFPSVTETTDYYGFSDTIFFKYDDEERLSEILTSSFDQYGTNYITKTEKNYNKNGNLISDCYFPKDYMIQCSYSNYVYGSKGQIISRKDSADFKIDWDLSKPFEYFYDSAGNIISDGDYKYSFNPKNSILSKIPLRKYFIGFEATLDKEGRKINEIEVYSPNFAKNENLNQSWFKYDNRGLLIEKKILYKNKLISIINYDYK